MRLTVVKAKFILYNGFVEKEVHPHCSQMATFAAVAPDLRCTNCKTPLQIRVHAKGL